MTRLPRPGGAFRGWMRALVAPAHDSRQTGSSDPRLSFAHAYHRQRELLEQVRAALSAVRAAAERIRVRQAELGELADRLQEQARSQLLAGRDDLARAVLAQRLSARLRLRALAGEVAEMEQEEARLRLVEQRLATEIDSFYARQEVLAAQYAAAEAQARIDEALAGVSQELADFGLALESARHSTDRMQARAAALDELAARALLESGAASDLDAGTDSVEAELASLRRQLAGTGDGGAA